MPEDETLLEADTGIVPFNLGKSIYLGLLKDLGRTDSWSRIQQTDRYEGKDDFGKEGFFSQLDRIDGYFEDALKRGISRPEIRSELEYYIGWAAYARGNYRKALAHWEQIPMALQQQFRNIDLAKSHGLYKAALADPKSRDAYLDASLGYLIFLRDKYSKSAANIRKPAAENKIHRQLFTRLSIIENNMGAIYELKNNEKQALLHYYQSITYSKQIAEENETAQLNVRLAFKRTGLEEKEAYPIIMDFVPPFTDEEPRL